ncbi:SDR family oxidoreductase [Klebsiella quasipneumoniae]|uniref:SDR family oxidoreductase n=1 Tax=Klebsiella quasipneumoniae TaxID=1463165 RepID=UPI0021C103BB|nr:SDR family oxidoreductase [Klebsiella quasipneumoniae]MCT8891694.1 SDR family oxidoreductase [Klebsiella quasipneumoniae subsp. similipneumoniae]
MRLNNKVALITGATSGIGLATAELFLENGANVVLIGRDKSRLDSISQKFGARAMVLQADVNDIAALKNIHDEIEKKHGLKSIDVYFANAGIAYSTPLNEADSASYDVLMNTNVKSLFFSMKIFSPLFSDGASVILNSAWLNTVGAPGFSVLAASKAAVRSFARSWSAELLERKIRVNCVSPGAIDTPIFDLEGGTKEDVIRAKRDLASKIPVGRMGTSEEIAEAVLFLASDESKYILGAEIMVDGGFSQL